MAYMICECGYNTWNLEWHEDYSHLIVCKCNKCGYVNTLYLKEED